MGTKHDFTSLEEVLNKRIGADEICESLIGMAFNYSRCLDADYADRFREDMAVIELLVSEFDKLRRQE